MASLGEVRVGQLKGVEGCVALVVPQQLVFQKLERFQRENHGFVFQKAVHVQPWGREEQHHTG